MLVPYDLLTEHIDTVNDFRQAIIKVRSQCGRQGPDYTIPTGIEAALGTKRFEIKQDLRGDGATLFVFDRSDCIAEMPLSSVGSCVQQARDAYGVDIDTWVQHDQ